MALAGIAFDAFGTLFDLGGLERPAREVAGERGRELAAELPARLLPLTWHATVAGDYRPIPELAALALASLAREREIPLDDAGAERIAAGMSSLPAYPRALEALEALAPTPLAILSNGTRDGVEALAERGGLADLFDHYLSVERVRRFKPAPEVYALAPRAFSADAGAVVLVSGNEWDVAGAQLAGLRGAFVARGRPVTRFLGQHPEVVCDELTDLAEALSVLET